MAIEITVPSVGESVTEATLAQWYRKDGDPVRKDEPLFVLETDKVTLEIEAEADGVLKITVAEGETVAIGAVVGSIDTDAAPHVLEEPAPPKVPAEPPAAPPSPADLPTPKTVEESPLAPISEPILPPSVRRLVAEKNLDVSSIVGTGPGGRITKGDVVLYLEQAEAAPPKERPSPPAARHAISPSQAPAEARPAMGEEISRKPMSQIRRRIAERLLEAKQNTAMLTTFNEIDMSRVQALRGQFQESFQEKHQLRLGIMSFFIKAAVEALKEFPEINAFIDDKDIIYHHYYHIGVAIGGERGLVVPVIRHADQLGFAALEKAVLDYVKKIRENRLELADLEGGTFTITNGGVFGSLLSTPILNMPQSGILGMHKIEDRPVVINGELLVRPMMYVALSYDHRIVDGREAVTFLVRIKQLIEAPERMLMDI